MKYFLIALLFSFSAFADVEAVFSRSGGYAVILIQNNGDAKRLYQSMNVDIINYSDGAVLIKKINYHVNQTELNIECDYLKALDMYTCGISLNKSDNSEIDPVANRISFDLLNGAEELVQKFFVEIGSGTIYLSNDERLMLSAKMTIPQSFSIEFN